MLRLFAFPRLIAVMLLPTPSGLPVAGQIMLALLLFSVILWATEAVDYAISAVLITALMAFMLGMAPNAAKPEAVLGTGPALTLAMGGPFLAHSIIWSTSASSPSISI